MEINLSMRNERYWNTSLHRSLGHTDIIRCTQSTQSGKRTGMQDQKVTTSQHQLKMSQLICVLATSQVRTNSAAFLPPGCKLAESNKPHSQASPQLFGCTKNVFNIIPFFIRYATEKLEKPEAGEHRCTSLIPRPIPGLGMRLWIHKHTK